MVEIKENKKINIIFRATETQQEAIKKRADELGIPISSYIRLLITKDLKKKLIQ